MKRRHVPRDVRRHCSDEVSRAAQLVFGIIEPRDYECDDLLPEATLMDHADGVQNIVNHSTKLPVAFVVHRLQINLVAISPWTKVIEDLRRRVAVRNERCAKSFRPRFLKYFNRPLRSDQRLVV